MAHSLIYRHYNAIEPQNTLSFVKSDDESAEVESPEEKIHTLPLPTDKGKTDKSVRFATEEESLSTEDETDKDSLQTSKDVVTWVPSEHLYSDDTFILETNGGEVKDSQTTAQTYGSNTFIDLDSDDETKTESIRSDTYSDSFASSDIFSSQNGSSLYRSWRDVTEIVKDIEDLEESEFVTHVDSAHLSFDEGEATDAEDSFEEQLARHEFIDQTVHGLISKNERCPQVFSDKSCSSDDEDFINRYLKQQAFTASEKKCAVKFCQQMAKTFRQKSDLNPGARKDQEVKEVSPLYKETIRRKNLALESYGLSANLVQRLKTENCKYVWEKKSEELKKEIEKSEQFVRDNQYVEEENARKQFLSRTCAHILKVNTDDMIQAHLIKMNPITCFAEFVKKLPKQSTDVREILYEYRRQVQVRNKQTDKE